MNNERYHLLLILLDYLKDKELIDDAFWYEALLYLRKKYNLPICE